LFFTDSEDEERTYTSMWKPNLGGDWYTSQSQNSDFITGEEREMLECFPKNPHWI
jgi:hypothetical protein